MLTTTARAAARAAALTTFPARTTAPAALAITARATTALLSFTALAARTTPRLAVAVRALGLRLLTPTRTQLHLSSLELPALRRLLLHRRHGQRLRWRWRQRGFGGGQPGPCGDEHDGGEQHERPGDVAPADARAQRRKTIGIHVLP